MTDEPLLKTAGRVFRKVRSADGGKLKIGDDWNAIRIIALSQSNPLKACGAEEFRWRSPGAAS